MPALNRVHSNLAPSASRISKVASRISGPIPSPSISVAGVVLMATLPIYIMRTETHVSARLELYYLNNITNCY